jgi:hypothetical protein
VAGHTPRVELNFARVSYDAQPALLVSAVEISSRADQGMASGRERRRGRRSIRCPRAC